jgi:hypothetical protein
MMNGTATDDRLSNGLEQELIDLQAVEADFIDVEGLAIALRIVEAHQRGSVLSGLSEGEAGHAVSALVDALHAAVRRVRHGLDGGHLQDDETEHDETEHKGEEAAPC